MSATAVNKASSFYGTTIGKKAVMALTGFILAGFVFAHVAGNLQIFSGAAALNGYSALLHASPELLWAVRLVLITAVVLHVWAAVQLYALKSAARPVAYAKKAHRASSLPSRFMIWTGYALAAFIVFHLLHFTTGTVHPDFVPGDVFHNVTTAFRSPPIVAVYVAAMVFLAMHLHHGLWSFTQSLGLSNPRYSERIKGLAKVLAVLVAAGFVAVPIAVLAGVVK
jgi:succinate dehydrogenase / fumarate reductase cytochrome b subunit